MCMRIAAFVVAVSLVGAGGLWQVEAAGSEDTTLRTLYAKADYREIVKRFRDAGRVRQLSPDSRRLLVKAMLPDHSAELLGALMPSASDDELAVVAVVAAVRGVGRWDLEEAWIRRLRRTNTGRLAIVVNTRAFPAAPRALAPIRDARVAVIERFFLNAATPDAKAEALHTLVTLTTEAFKKDRFSPELPAPPPVVAPTTLAELALKLSVLPYVDQPEEVMTLFSAVGDAPLNGGTK